MHSKLSQTPIVPAATAVLMPTDPVHEDAIISIHFGNFFLFKLQFVELQMKMWVSGVREHSSF